MENEERKTPGSEKKHEQRARVHKAFKGTLYLNCGTVVEAKDFTVCIKREAFIGCANDFLRNSGQELPASGKTPVDCDGSEVIYGTGILEGFEFDTELV